MTYQLATHMRCFMFTLGAVFAPDADSAIEFARANGLTGVEAMAMHAELLSDMHAAYRRIAHGGAE